jgi:hypothetical protein
MYLQNNLRRQYFLNHPHLPRQQQLYMNFRKSLNMRLSNPNPRQRHLAVQQTMIPRLRQQLQRKQM